MSQMTKRAARAAMRPVLLGVAEAHRSPPERGFAEGVLVFGAAKTSDTTFSRQAVPGGGDFFGGEERSNRGGARSACHAVANTAAEATRSATAKV